MSYHEPTTEPITYNKILSKDNIKDYEIKKIFEQILSDEYINYLIEHRKKLKKPLTQRSAELMLKKLKAFNDPREAVDAMILRGWISIEKDWLKGSNNQSSAKSKAGRLENALGKYEHARDHTNTIESRFEYIKAVE